MLYRKYLCRFYDLKFLIFFSLWNEITCFGMYLDRATLMNVSQGADGSPALPHYNVTVQRSRYDALEFMITGEFEFYYERQNINFTEVLFPGCQVRQWVVPQRFHREKLIFRKAIYISLVLFSSSIDIVWIFFVKSQTNCNPSIRLMK